MPEPSCIAAVLCTRTRLSTRPGDWAEKSLLKRHGRPRHGFWHYWAVPQGSLGRCRATVGVAELRELTRHWRTIPAVLSPLLAVR